MHLSKQEFSKLPKSERNKLMNLKAKGAKQAPKKKANMPRASLGKQSQGRQASVAAAYSTQGQGKAPRIKSTRDTCNIVHREFIGNVSGSANFTLGNTFSVNPGLQATFPWLSIMAQGWEEYRFRYLRFCYYTRTGSNTPGSVILAPDYDASDAVPATEQIMTSYDEVREDAPWKDNCCALKASLMSGASAKRHFVRVGALSPNQDVKLYDVANFYVGTVDGTAIPWGKLWVEYDIDFFIPQLPPNGPANIVGGTISSGGTLTAGNPLGTAPVVQFGSTGITANATSLVTFANAGNYLLNLQATGVALSGLTATAVAGCTASLISNTVNGTSTGIVSIYEVSVTAQGATLQLAGAATTLTSCVLKTGVAPTGSI